MQISLWVAKDQLYEGCIRGFGDNVVPFDIIDSLIYSSHVIYVIFILRYFYWLMIDKFIYSLVCEMRGNLVTLWMSYSI